MRPRVHPLLEKQLVQAYGSLDAAPKELQPLLELVSASYASADDDKALLQRAMALSSEELVTRNIELTSAYERLQQLDKFRAQFLNNAAHELGTPLTPIKMQLHLLKRALAQDQEADPLRKKSLATLERNLDRLSILVADVLDAAKLQSDRLKLELSPVDVRALLLDAHDAYEGLAADRGVRLLVQPPAGQAIARGDARRVTQVLFNLLNNALKFTPRGGTVRIDAEENEPDIIVRVSDTGLGIPPDKLGRLFQPFSQVHDTMQSTASGTGLGLYIAKGIIEGCGGSIWAESGGEGKGTTFAFSLPRAG